MRPCSTCQRSFDDRLRFCPEDGAALGEPDACGQVLEGGFRLDAVLGRGATGTVYRGWQLGVERPVAVKVLHPELAAEPELVARFFREARAVARLSHPSLATVYTVGTTGDAAPFLVMELVDGVPFEEVLRAGPLAADRAARIARQIALALAEAHAAGIVHRDLKPENLVLSRARGGGEAVTILDFGIAKVLDPGLRLAGESHLTREGEVFGTPQYLSPEQAAGGAVDHRADLYSLGVLLYRMLAGRLPFDGTGLSLLVAHMTQPVPPLPRAIPRRLAAVVHRLLEKEPDARHASAEALIAALDAATAPAIDDGSLPFAATAVLTSGDPGRSGGRERVRAATDPAALGLRPPSGRRRGRAWLVAGILALALAAAGAQAGGALVTADDRFGAAAPGDRRVAAAPAPAPIASVPRRAVMVGEGGYSLRALVPETLTAGAPQDIVLDAWDPAGRPLTASAIVVLVVDASGDERGVAAEPADLPGRYVVRESFPRSGPYVLRVLPPSGQTSIRVHLEVADAPDAPTS